MKRISALAVAALVLSSCSLARHAALEPDSAAHAPMKPSADVVAFCGPSTKNPYWKQQLWTLRTIGATAVHGYCYDPIGYTVLEPGQRYAPQSEYLELAREAQRIGIGVVVYDPTFWTDPATAAAVWAEYIADGTLVAVDLGDEPGWADMPELARRAEIVRTAGVEPQIIFINGRLQNIIDQHEAVPTACPTTNDYEQNAPALMDAFSLRHVAGCAGIAIDSTGRNLDGDGDRWSILQMRRALNSNFRITLFTGVQPENFPEWDALVDSQGKITEAGRAVRAELEKSR